MHMHPVMSDPDQWLSQGPCLHFSRRYNVRVVHCTSPDRTSCQANPLLARTQHFDNALSAMSNECAGGIGQMQAYMPGINIPLRLSLVEGACNTQTRGISSASLHHLANACKLSFTFA